MKAIYLAAALLISGAALSSASAAPLAPMQGVTHQGPVIDVQYYHRDDDRYRRDDDRRYRRHTPPPPRYRPGYRYRSAPHGWHRYDRRPGDWRRRGCVIVGPMWFCP
ncbi:MAG: hypothetical protein JSR61_13380 [Proteobacteria bacterium]|nr:hypothetical protein [Pseudomonadota bacterium]